MQNVHIHKECLCAQNWLTHTPPPPHIRRQCMHTLQDTYYAECTHPYTLRTVCTHPSAHMHAHSIPSAVCHVECTFYRCTCKLTCACMHTYMSTHTYRHKHMPTLHTCRDTEQSACALCSISGPAVLFFRINCADRGLQDILPQFPSLPVLELFLVFKSRHCSRVQPSRVLNLPLFPLFSLSLPSLRELLLLFALSLLCLHVTDLPDMGSCIQAQAAVFEAEGGTAVAVRKHTCLKSAQAPTERSLLPAAPHPLRVPWVLHPARTRTAASSALPEGRKPGATAWAGTCCQPRKGDSGLSPGPPSPSAGDSRSPPPLPATDNGSQHAPRRR
ncbi:uncharacterized protein LOC134167057 [Pezoporus occidentalis]|uniref:uncharacterized protein LOC134167057 n=1 Tax=Pezoporus occidentalis TaxID=407982 RepID=UPI002F90CDF6